MRSISGRLSAWDVRAVLFTGPTYRKVHRRRRPHRAAAPASRPSKSFRRAFSAPSTNQCVVKSAATIYGWHSVNYAYVYSPADRMRIRTKAHACRNESRPVSQSTRITRKSGSMIRISPCIHLLMCRRFVIVVAQII